MARLHRVDGPEPHEYEITQFRVWTDTVGELQFQGIVPERTALKGQFQVEHEGRRYDVIGAINRGGLQMGTPDKSPEAVPVIVGAAISGALKATA